MKRDDFRILFNGYKYKVQKLTKSFFGGLKWEDQYSLWGGIREFDSKKDAEDAINRHIYEEVAKYNTWRVVE